ncbi:hypothetical protein [Paraurantiacibacter namhicola]|uniref:DUF2029 domain-containing protein n=1 Tax=Paraurantiacibacter namhicola TaxID=645517 RepID=A0A1C7DBG8_9SPHN|nr:hypothetical protein [Paraurantiacibacter namhicola]ANU08836.1 hypothetical protein A6F65_02558 [Paraurantiacibacter namhicola]
MSGIPDLVSRFAALERPLRLLPRWAALALLLAVAAASVWSVSAVSAYDDSWQSDVEVREERGDMKDMDLYENIAGRVAAGEGYYSAATAEQRANGFPTSPAVTVRLPTLAQGAALFGIEGWRWIAIALFFANILAWTARLSGRTLLIERVGAALMVAACGATAFMDKVGLVHEIVAGQFLALAFALYRPHRWWPALLLAACALAVRELAAPFVLLWLAFALVQCRWREAGAVAALLAIFAIGMVLHAQGVAAHRLPEDLASEGWQAMGGPVVPLYGVLGVTLLQTLPGWIGPPLVVLSLLGWAGLGGRTGGFGTLWFAGFMIAAALFARLENFYWLALLVPAFGAGIALAPRALMDLVAALFRPSSRGAAASGSR